MKVAVAESEPDKRISTINTLLQAITAPLKLSHCNVLKCFCFLSSPLKKKNIIKLIEYMMRSYFIFPQRLHFKKI